MFHPAYQPTDTVDDTSARFRAIAEDVATARQSAVNIPVTFLRRFVARQNVPRLSAVCFDKPGFEDIAVDGTVNHERGDDAAAAQSGDHGGRFPMAVRHAQPQALATPTAAVASGHIGAGPRLIHEHQPFGGEVDLALEPGPAVAQNIGAVLLGGMGRLFLRVSLCRAKKRHSVP